MNPEVLVTAIIGLLSSITSGWVTWFFTRKKYNSEVDNNLIINMQQSLDFYTKLSDDNKARLDEALKRNDELERRDAQLEREVRELKDQVFKLMSTICTDLSCQLRKKNLDSINGERTATNIKKDK